MEAIASRVIPSGGPGDDAPGAREAGIVYFLDRALVTFAREHQKLYTEGLADLQVRTRERFPGVEKFSSLHEDPQDEIRHALDTGPTFTVRVFAQAPPTQSFFETLRQHTILGFLIDPESNRKGNQGGVGWKLIARENTHMFQPPFGHYDKGYPGWQPMAVEAGKK